MIRHLRRSLLVSLLGAAALVSAACSSSPTVGATRVVGVSKQINEFIYAVHAESVLVGRDLGSVYPEQIERVPSVGYHRALSAEAIISAKPTLLLTDGNVGPDAVLDQVRKAGIRVDTLTPGGTVDSAQAVLLALGQRFDRQREADALVAAWRAGMDSLWHDTVQWYKGSTHPRVLIIHFGQMRNDYLALGRGGPTDAMLQWAGAINAVDSVGGTVPLTPELIARAAPDVIVATDVGFDRYGSVEKFKSLPGVARTPAARANRIHRIDEQEIMYFGPRTPAVVRKLASWFGTDSATANRPTPISYR